MAKYEANKAKREEKPRKSEAHVMPKNLPAKIDNSAPTKQAVSKSRNSYSAAYTMTQQAEPKKSTKWLVFPGNKKMMGCMYA